MTISVGVSFRLRFPDRSQLPADWLLRALVFAGIVALAFYVVGLYDYWEIRLARSLWLKLIQGYALGGAILGLLYYFSGQKLMLGRGVFLISGVSSMVLISAWRQLYRWALRRSLFTERVLIVGTDSSAVDLARDLVDRDHLGYRVVGFLSSDATQVGTSLFNPSVIGTIDQVADVASVHGVTRVVVAQGDHRGKLDLDALLDCKRHGIQVSSLPAYVEELMGRVMVEDPRLRSRLVFSEGFVVSRPVRFGKRLSDIVVSSLGLVLLAPTLLLVAVAVRLSSKGPILYRQERTGKEGKSFVLMKFRSMDVDAEHDGAQWATSRDPRVTAVGRLLRKTRMDELPQLWNVLRGDMSLVGPRPERPIFVDQLMLMNPVYAQRLTVRPGLTGWAQIKAPYAASFEEQIEKLEYDLYYIKNLSLALDLSILASSLRIMLLGSGAR